MGNEKSEWHSNENLIRICEAPLSLLSIEFNVSILDIPQYRAVARWGWGGFSPPIFGRSANPISTRGDTLSPPSTTSPPGISDLATALYLIEFPFSYSEYFVQGCH